MSRSRIVPDMNPRALAFVRKFAVSRELFQRHRGIRSQDVLVLLCSGVLRPKKTTEQCAIPSDDSPAGLRYSECTLKRQLRRQNSEGRIMRRRGVLPDCFNYRDNCFASSMTSLKPRRVDNVVVETERGACKAATIVETNNGT